MSLAQFTEIAARQQQAIGDAQAEAARQCEINKTYWTRLLNGIKDWPSDETLAKLGLRRNVSYEWIKQPRAGKKAAA